MITNSLFYFYPQECLEGHSKVTYDLALVLKDLGLYGAFQHG